MLMMTPERMYWKQEVRKRVVSSELKVLNFLESNTGGIYLGKD